MLGKDTAMRLGLIGLGRIGAFHAGTLSHLDEVESLVVTDAVPAVTASVAERFGAKSADSPEALIGSGVDGIVIAAATDAHTALIRAGVDAGIPVFCEKPLSALVEDAVAIADHVNASGVPVQVGYPRRFDPAYLAARSAVAAGELGWVHTVRSTTLDPAPPPRGYVAVSGGTFRDGSVHDFDTVRWVTGREVVEVYATGSARATTSSPSSATSPPRRPCSPSTTVPLRSCPTPATTRAGTTYAWSCTAPSTVSPPSGRSAPRSATSSGTPPGRPESPGRSSWTGSSTRSAPS
jgi:predicted dehydrogenase